MGFKPHYVFREGEEVLAYQLWDADESAQFIHEACANNAQQREFPLYLDDLRSAQGWWFLKHEAGAVHCLHCGRLIAEASDLRSRVAEIRSLMHPKREEAAEEPPTTLFLRQ